MKILHIIYDDIKNPWCGGGGALRVFEVNKYIGDQNNVVVITGNYPGAKNEKIGNVQYVRIGLKSSYILSRISFTLLVPFYIRRYKSDLLVNECSYFSPCFADIYTRRPVINVIHHLMGKHSFKLYPLAGFFPFLSEKIFLNTVKNVITSTKAVKEDIQKKGDTIKIINLGNGVAEELFELVPEEKQFILFLGRIDIYMKGLDILVKSFSNLSNQNVTLKIAGSGKQGDVEKLNKIIEAYHLKERVAVLGKVSDLEKYELFKTCLFLVMPSRFEGWGITAVEANAAGKSVIGTNIKGLSEAVANNKTAILLEPENDQALTESMNLLIEDPQKRNKFGKQGRQWAKQFSWKSIAKEQFDFYTRVLKN